MAAQAGDGTSEHGLHALTQADLARHVTGDALVDRTAHELERLLDARLRENIQIWRLLQLHGQRLFQSAVKYRVASSVHEIGEKNGIFLCERRGAVTIEEHAGQDGNQHHGCTEHQPRPLTLRRREGGNSRRLRLRRGDTAAGYRD